MATFTENYDLIKPEDTDPYDVENFNENMDTIDAAMAEFSTQADAISDKIGDADDTGTSTVFGKLNQMGSGGSGLTAIKSIQRFSVTLPTSQGSASKNFNTVDPDKCILLMYHLHDSTSLKSPVEYTLYADHIDLTTSGISSGSMTLLFQIIEFC